MKCALVFAYLANLILGIMGLLVLPERVAARFGPGGAPGGWMSPSMNFIIMFAVYTLLLVVFLGIPWWLQKLPAKWINIPNKTYWLQEENWSHFKESFSRSCMQYGLATLAFFFCIGALVFDANINDPVQLRMVPFWIAFWAYILYTILWLALLLRSLSLPHHAAASEL